MAQIDLKQATITIKDGSTPANSVTVRVGEGNLTWTETVNREYKLNRGTLDEVRNGDEEPVSLNFDFVWDYITGSSDSGSLATIEDALKKVGNAAAWVSSDTDICRPYAVDIEVLYTPDCSTGDKESILFPDFRYETLEHDLSEGTISCAGRCNVTAPTPTRTPQV